jgi:DNA-binding NtrC family response regulator
VRELRNIAEYAVTLCHGETVMPAHLPAYLFQAKAEARRAERERKAGRSPSGPFGQPGTLDGSDMTGDAQAASGDGGEHLARTSVSDLERRLIADALHRTGNRRGEAAELLGWGRSTLWRKMKQYGMC